MSIAGYELHLPGDKAVIAEFGDYIFGEDVKVVEGCSDKRVLIKLSVKTSEVLVVEIV